VNEVGAVVLAAVLVLCAAAAWWLRARDGALRPTAADTDGDIAALGALGALGVRPGEADLTVVQFSTATCAPCRATRARLERLQAGRSGLAVVHVDAEEHLDAVRALDVRRTPTLFYVARDGTLVGRSSGAPRADELTALVGAHTASLPGAAT
jgi:hypothetical protein